MEHIFERFYRVDKSHSGDRRDRTWSCYCKECGGHASRYDQSYSQLGRGTTFAVRILDICVIKGIMKRNERMICHSREKRFCYVTGLAARWTGRGDGSGADRRTYLFVNNDGDDWSEEEYEIKGDSTGRDRRCASGL